MAAGGDRQRPRLTPVFAFRFDLEAMLAEAGDGGVEVGGDDRNVAGRGDGRLLLGHQVHLRALALEPGVLAQRLRRFDPLEPDQLEEAGSGLDVFRRDLDPDVVEHAQEFTEMDLLCMLLSATVTDVEAMVADREAEMVEWDDGRLDERFRQIDQRFDQTEKKMDEGFARMDAGFARVDASLRELNGRFDGAFGELNSRFDRGFGELNSRLDGGLGELNGRFDAMQRTLLGVSGVIIAALIGVIATQL